MALSPSFHALAIGTLAVFASAAQLRAAGGTKENVQQEAATIELKGLLTALHTANLSSRSTGVIRTMMEEGQEFHKDDIVVQMDDDNEKLNVESSKALLQVRTSENERSDTLSKKGTESQSNRDIAIANFKTAQIQLKQAEVALERKSVHAPFDGVVIKRIRQPGEATDNFLPLVSVADVSQLYLETYLPASRLRDVQPGQTVEVSVPDLSNKKFTGKVEFIAPVIDAASGDFRMKILLDNSDHILRAGMGAVGLLPLPPHNSEVQRTGAVTPSAGKEAK